MTGNEGSITVEDTPKKRGKTKNEKSKTKKSEPLIYVGPNLVNGRLSRFMVLRDGVPVYLSDLLEKQPEIKQLIVPLGRFSETLQRLQISGTIEHQASKSLLERKGDK